MPNLTKYRKPSGAIVVVNDSPANIAHAAKLGWVKADADTEPSKPKRSKKAQP